MYPCFGTKYETGNENQPVYMFWATKFVTVGLSDFVDSHGLSCRRRDSDSVGCSE